VALAISRAAEAPDAPAGPPAAAVALAGLAAGLALATSPTPALAGLGKAWLVGLVAGAPLVAVAVPGIVREHEAARPSVDELLEARDVAPAHGACPTCGRVIALDFFVSEITRRLVEEGEFG
jgi:hypothetical protein